MISSAHSPWETDPLYPKKFSHIYVEEAVRDDPVTKKILAVFPDAEKVPIVHYKDVFNRRRQNVSLQHKCQNLILAKRSGSAVFPGAPVCQSFGNEHFYYCSSVMNCLCNCSSAVRPVFNPCPFAQSSARHCYNRLRSEYNDTFCHTV